MAVLGEVIWYQPAVLENWTILKGIVKFLIKPILEHLSFGNLPFPKKISIRK
jgi:hypothetical protein